MLFNKVELHELYRQTDEIIEKLRLMENAFKQDINKVHPSYRKSAINLVHYLALRSYNVDELQDKFRNLGLPGLSNVEAHVMTSLLKIQSILGLFLGKPVPEKINGVISIGKSKKILDRNANLLFGSKLKKRRTRIMVTLPSFAADDYRFVNRLLKAGMNSARVNCAHDDSQIWEKMIDNVRRSGEKNSRNCKVMMDLGGPKLRTGPMQAGPQIIQIKPEKDRLGRILKPAKLWLAPPGIDSPDDEATHIPVSEEWLKIVKKNDYIELTDTRRKTVKIIAGRKKTPGRWAYCYTSAYVMTGTSLTLFKPDNQVKQAHQIGELHSEIQSIILNKGEYLILHAKPVPGEAADYNINGKLIRHAHISCTLPEVIKDVRQGEPIFFDDGKIEGVIEKAEEDELLIRIIHAKNNGSKLKPDKGINLPNSDLKISGLTEKDKNDLGFVVRHADTINLSFVNDDNDVQQLFDELEKYDAEVGVILKIETQKGFRNLPRILLKAMQKLPIGVMIARGDLAVESGWKNFAGIQEEIFRICEAAHIPVVLATQVLENLTKSGTPTRAEITDAAVAQRAECVMLNKGAYIGKSVKLLDVILRRMQHFQKKKESILPRLNNAEELILWHDDFDQD